MDIDYETEIEPMIKTDYLPISTNIYYGPSEYGVVTWTWYLSVLLSLEGTGRKWLVVTVT